MEFGFARSGISMRRLFLYIFAALLLVILVNFGTSFYLLFSGPNSGAPSKPLLRQPEKQDETADLKYDLTKINVDDLTSRVQELLAIRVSVLKELRQLERNRSAVIQQINQRNNELDKLKTQIVKRSTELERLQLYIKQATLAHKEAKDRVDTLIEPPLDLLPKHAQSFFLNETIENNFESAVSHRHCQMYNCFDYSRCSLFSPFYVYIYNFEDANFRAHREKSKYISILSLLFKTNVHVTKNPKIACVYMFVIFEKFTYLNDRDKFANYLYTLPYWGGDGRNNIIVNLNSRSLKQIGVDPRKAMLVQSSFTNSDYRAKYDLILPNLQSSFNYSTSRNNQFAPLLSPARRKYFLSFLGSIEGHTQSNQMFFDVHVKIKEALLNLISKHNNAAHNEFLFDFDCDEKTKRLCENQTIILLDSTFTLILPPFAKSKRDSSQLFSSNLTIYDDQLNFKIMNSFSSGAIPILVGGDYISLPFEDAIDWNRAVIRIPIARITELYVVLKTFTDSDIIEMRRFGSYIYQSYFSSLDSLVNTLFAFLRNVRLKIPSKPVGNEFSEFYFNQSKFDQIHSNQSIYSLSKIYTDDEENVGPLEPPFSSLVYRRNLSISLTQQYITWNELHNSPFHTFPSLPSDPVLPSESKFIGSAYRFRPINEGTGGSGREFSEALGGNFICEQFTIVFLTYEREAILLTALQRLKDLPYLNKVIVVWNSPNPPSPGIKWPEIGVDIVVIKSKKNSLNNRFLPFDEIKTDAILSMDDDASFRHDEIIFAFRVWREARDRIVGFPARYHAWDAAHSAWLYNSNYTCEFSMILTGAAFFHKYYAYLYTYSMPSPIREKVDEYMNCEDIAMNFLVSHVSRKPPIKVTSRWTFRCPDCVSSLSEEDLHYQRRHKCLNYFTSVYGYMPLLYTQFRADSVLFKTRIPHDKQKCFKYI